MIFLYIFGTEPIFDRRRILERRGYDFGVHFRYCTVFDRRRILKGRGYDFGVDFRYLTGF